MRQDPNRRGNPIRGRLNAWLLRALDGYMHQKYGARKAALLRNPPSTTVELGPGTGANLRYIGANTRLVAIEPNRQMHKILLYRARQYGIDLELHDTSADSIDLADGSVDLVFCSLVLCTVDRPDAVLEEVRRILRLGGRFICIEHVRAPSGSPTRGVQRLLERPWRWMFEGCHLCRDAGAMLQAAGFSEIDLEPFRLSTLIFPVAYQIQAVCER